MPRVEGVAWPPNECPGCDAAPATWRPHSGSYDGWTCADCGEVVTARRAPAPAGDGVEYLLDVLSPDYYGSDDRVLAARERIRVRYGECKDAGMDFTTSARTARAEWLRANLASRPALTPPAGEVGDVEALAVKATLYANGWTPCPNCGRDDGAVFIEGVWICADCQSRRPNDVTLDVQRVLHDCARTLRALAAQAREAEEIAFMCPGDGPLPTRVAAAIHEVQDRAGAAEDTLRGVRGELQHTREVLGAPPHLFAAEDAGKLIAERDALRVRVAELEEERGRLELTDAQVAAICGRLGPTWSVPVGAMKWALGAVGIHTNEWPDGTRGRA